MNSKGKTKEKKTVNIPYCQCVNSLQKVVVQSKRSCNQCLTPLFYCVALSGVARGAVQTGKVFLLHQQRHFHLDLRYLHP